MREAVLGEVYLRDTIRLGTLIVGKEPQGIVKIGSVGRSVDYM
jgi:hypothetical protein